MASGRRWMIQDLNGNEIYLTHERWVHIIEPGNHPEMKHYEKQLQEAIRAGIRRQDPLNPQKFRYAKAFDDLAADNTHIVAIVLFRFSVNCEGMPIPNNYIVTAYQKEMG